MSNVRNYKDKKFLNRLAELRQTKSEKAFADTCGLPRTTLRGYLKGTSPPNLQTLRQIAESHGVTVGWLVDDETIIYKDRSPHQVTDGNSNITIGGKVNGSQIKTTERTALPIEGFLSEDEKELITMVRDLGGKRIIQKFKQELIRLQQFIDEG